MNLDHIPVRLGEEGTRRWREEILGLYRGAQADAALEEEHLREDLERALDSKSVRAPLSRFLNGHGDEIRKWLCADGGEPNDKGRALATLCKCNVDALCNKLLGYLPQRRTSRLQSEDFEHLALEVSNISEHIPEIPSTSLPMPLGDVLGIINASGKSADVIAHQAMALETDLIARFYKQPTCSNAVTLRVEPVRGEVWRAWFRTLRELGRIDDPQLEVLTCAFAKDHSLAQRWPAPKVMLTLLDAIMSGQMLTASYEAVARFDVTRQKDALLSNCSASVVAWARHSGKFFKRWFERYGHAAARVDGARLRELLEIEQAPEIDLDTALALVDASFVGDRESARDIIARTLLSKIQPLNLLHELKEGGVLQVCKGDPGWFELSDNWARVAYAEFGFELEPSDLSWLGADFFTQEITLAIQCAPREKLLVWIEAVLDEPDRAKVACTILSALVSRIDLASCIDDDILKRLWAQGVWYQLSSRTSSSEEEEFVTVSKAFSTRLPRLDPHAPHKDLQELLCASYRERFVWEGADIDFVATRPEPKGDDKITYMGDPAHEPSPFGERWEENSHKFALDLTKLAPFQLPFEFIVRTYKLCRHTLVPPRRSRKRLEYELTLWWARQGSESARKAIWCSEIVRQEMSQEELVTWIPSLEHDELHMEGLRPLDKLLAWVYTRILNNKHSVALAQHFTLALKQVYEHVGYIGSEPGPFRKGLQTFEFLHLFEGVLLLADLEPEPSGEEFQEPNDHERREETMSRVCSRYQAFARWLQQFIPDNDEDLDFSPFVEREPIALEPMRQVIELASAIDQVDVLRRALYLDNARFDLFMTRERYVVDHDGRVKNFHAAELLCELYNNALKALWEKGEPGPLWEFERSGRPFQLRSPLLARRRLESAIRRCVKSTIMLRSANLSGEIPDHVWEAFVAWWFPAESLSCYLERHNASNALKLFPERTREIAFPSPILDADPALRREIIIKTLGSYEERSLDDIPREILRFLVESLGLETMAHDKNLGVWRANEITRKELISWAMEHDDTILSRWCEACLDPDNHEESWQKLKDWSLADQPRRVERIWPYIEKEHQRELSDRLESNDPVLHIFRSLLLSPELSNLLDDDDENPYQVALRRLSQSFDGSVGDPFLHRDEMEILDVIEDALEHQPDIAPHSLNSIERIFRSLRYADAIERVGPIRQRLKARLKKH